MDRQWDVPLSDRQCDVLVFSMKFARMFSLVIRAQLYICEGYNHRTKKMLKKLNGLHFHTHADILAPLQWLHLFVDTHVCCCAQFFPEGLHFMTAQLTHVFLMPRFGSRFGYETMNFYNFMACLILVVALMGLMQKIYRWIFLKETIS